MKTINVRDLQKRIKECVAVAQRDRVVITCHGKPAALLIGLEGKDWDTVVVESSPSFWKLVEKRRRERTMSVSTLRKRLKEGKR